MKKLLSVLAIAAITAASCSKDSLTSTPSSLSATSVDASHGADDPAGDDRGGGSLSGGGGTKISASSVPVMVMNAYKSKFPNATRAEWKKLNGNYKVQFYRSGVKWEAIFSPAGKLLKLERD